MNIFIVFLYIKQTVKIPDPVNWFDSVLRLEFKVVLVIVIKSNPLDDQTLLESTTD